MNAGVIHRALTTPLAVAAALCCGVVARPASGAEAQGAHSHRAPSLEQLCLSSNPECEATFVSALNAADEPADVVVTATSLGPEVHLRGATPLRFQKRAPWVRRLETLGKEGIPFVRMPRGPDRELVIGINRKGVLGFELKQTSNRQ